MTIDEALKCFCVSKHGPRCMHGFKCVCLNWSHIILFVVSLFCKGVKEGGGALKTHLNYSHVQV